MWKDVESETKSVPIQGPRKTRKTGKVSVFTGLPSIPLCSTKQIFGKVLPSFEIKSQSFSPLDDSRGVVQKEFPKRKKERFSVVKLARNFWTIHPPLRDN